MGDCAVCRAADSKAEEIEAGSDSELCLYTEAQVREAIRLAYEDAARIVMEPRRGLPVEAYRREMAGMATRILWRGVPPYTERGHGRLPNETDEEHQKRTR